MRYDGKSAGERFSPVKEGMEECLFAITSPVLCFGHCHVRPVMEQGSYTVPVDQIERQGHMVWAVEVK